MTYKDLQALRHYVYQAQKIIYETRSCIIFNAWRYLYDTIREREALELH